MKPFFYALLMGMGLLGCIKDDEPQFANTVKGNFDALWHIIDTRYCYLDTKNINWDSIKTVYSEQLTSVRDVYQLFDICGAMLGELQDGHVNLTSSFDRSRYWKWYSDYPANFNSSIIFSDSYLGANYRIAGGFRYGKIAADSIGYIYYSSFSDGFSASNIAYIFDQFKHCEGLIIDVRNNGGGTLTYSETLASYFFEKDDTTGYICHKTGNGHSDFSIPLPIVTKANSKWTKPVVVLTNRLSYSATNDFINRMKNAPRCQIIGDRTGGGGGLPLSSELPIGWTLRFSAAPMLDKQKNHTEMGITPDIQVDMNTADTQRDAIIDRAVTEIMNYKLK